MRQQSIVGNLYVTGFDPRQIQVLAASCKFNKKKKDNKTGKVVLRNRLEQLSLKQGYIHILEIYQMSVKEKTVLFITIIRN